MRKIKLTQGKAALVDDIDFEYLNQWKWYAHKGHNTFYALRREPCPNRGRILMHRVILECMDFKDFKKTDHIDGDGLNNQRYNLRPTTNQQNQANRKLNKSNLSGHRGVWWNSRVKKWQVQLRVNYKRIHLGYFNDLIEAAKAYNKAAKKHFGKYARLNKCLN